MGDKFILPNDYTDLAKLSLHFKRGMDLISVENYTYNRIRINIVNRVLGTDYFSQQDFSKLISFYKKPHHDSKANVLKLRKILPILDTEIQSRFNKIYNDVEGYIKKGLIKESAVFDGIIGKYWGYSFDQDATQLYKVPYIHIFKLEIVSKTNIICSTQNATMNGTNIVLLGASRIKFEVVSDNLSRNIVVVILIGNTTSGDLIKIPNFKSAYLDTGYNEVKCGRALLERADGTFDNFIPTSIPLSELANSNSFISVNMKFLKKSQLRLD